MDETGWNQEAKFPALREAKPEKRTAREVTIFGTFRKKFEPFAFILLICAGIAAIFAAAEIGKSASRNGWFSGGQPSGSDAAAGDPAVAETGSAETETQPENAETERQTEAQTEAVAVENRSVLPIEISDDPQRTFPAIGKTVLILHTHTSESYAGGDGDLYVSEDPSQTVFSAGDALTKRLQEKQIFAIHCRAVHDAPGNLGSYERSAESIRFFRERYPDLGLVIDLHRSLDRSAAGGVCVTVGTVGSEETEIEKNLSLAVALCRELESAGVTCLPVRLAGADLNQSLAPFSLTVEIGSFCDSPQEAQVLAEQVADALSSIINQSLKTA